MTAGRHASYGSGCDAIGQAARWPALRHAATHPASRRRAHSRGPSGRPADRAEPQPVRRAAGFPARAGGYCFHQRLSLRTTFGRDSNPPHTGLRRLLYLLSYRTVGAPGFEPGRSCLARPFAFVCPWRHALPQRTRFGGGAPAGLCEPWLAGQRDIRRLLFSEERASGWRDRQRYRQVIEIKGGFLFSDDGRRGRCYRVIPESGYNWIGFYLMR